MTNYKFIGKSGEKSKNLRAWGYWRCDWPGTCVGCQQTTRKDDQKTALSSPPSLHKQISSLFWYLSGCESSSAAVYRLNPLLERGSNSCPLGSDVFEMPIHADITNIIGSMHFKLKNAYFADTSFPWVLCNFD